LQKLLLWKDYTQPLLASASGDDDDSEAKNLETLDLTEHGLCRGRSLTHLAVDAQSGFGLIVLDGKEAIVQLLRAREVVVRVKVGGGPQSKGVTVRAVEMLEGGVSGDPNAIKGKEAKMVVVAQGRRAPAGVLVVDSPDRVEVWILDMFRDEPIVKKHLI
jgi:hypothetical protein